MRLGRIQAKQRNGGPIRLDHLSPEQRSRLMSTVRGQDTGVEITLRRLIWGKGFRYRKNHRVMGIKVDLAFPRYRIVVFIDGCFWHGCPICYKPPTTRTDYWSSKLKRNVANDERINNFLRASGFKVLRFWEHEVLKNARDCAQKINGVLG